MVLGLESNDVNVGAGPLSKLVGVEVVQRICGIRTWLAPIIWPEIFYAPRWSLRSYRPELDVGVSTATAGKTVVVGRQH